MKRNFYCILIVLLLPIIDAHAASLTGSNYTMQAPHIIASGGTSYSLNYTFKNVGIAGAFGGISESQNFILRAGIIFKETAQVPAQLSVSIYPATCPLGYVEPGAASYGTITVTNDGNIKECFSLRVTDTTGKKWDAVDETELELINQYRLKAVFTDTLLQDITQQDFSGEDIISEDTQPKLATDTVFATLVSGDNGTNVLPNNSRALWLKFDAPNIDTTQDTHHIWVIVGAEVQE